MCKDRAKLVRSQRIRGGIDIHRQFVRLWITQRSFVLSPTFYKALPTQRTQIVHNHVDETTSVKRHFSAKSTEPTTITTT